MSTRTIYQILGVDEEADVEVIHAAYRALAKRLHPDNGGDPEAFREIQDAWDILRDSRRRSSYDARLAVERLAASRPAAHSAPLTSQVYDPGVVSRVKARIGDWGRTHARMLLWAAAAISVGGVGVFVWFVDTSRWQFGPIVGAAVVHWFVTVAARYTVVVAALLLVGAAILAGVTLWLDRSHGAGRRSLRVWERRALAAAAVTAPSSIAGAVAVAFINLVVVVAVAAVVVAFGIYVLNGLFD